jgi:hypothetical protein
LRGRSTRHHLPAAWQPLTRLISSYALSGPQAQADEPMPTTLPGAADKSLDRYGSREWHLVAHNQPAATPVLPLAKGERA